VRIQVRFLESILIGRGSHEPRMELVLSFKRIRGYLDKNKKKLKDMIIIKITLKINYYCFRTEIIEIEKNMFSTFILFYFERLEFYLKNIPERNIKAEKTKENAGKCIISEVEELSCNMAAN